MNSPGFILDLTDVEAERALNLASAQERLSYPLGAPEVRNFIAPAEISVNSIPFDPDLTAQDILASMRQFSQRVGIARETAPGSHALPWDVEGAVLITGEDGELLRVVSEFDFVFDASDLLVYDGHDPEPISGNNQPGTHYSDFCDPTLTPHDTLHLVFNKLHRPDAEGEITNVNRYAVVFAAKNSTGAVGLISRLELLRYIGNVPAEFRASLDEVLSEQLRYESSGNYGSVLLDQSPIVVHEDTPTWSVLEEVREKRAGSALILNREFELTGIVTVRDFAMKALGRWQVLEAPISEIASENPITLDFETATVARMLNVFEHSHIRHVPVLRDGQVFATACISGVVDHLYDHCPFLANQPEHQPFVLPGIDPDEMDQFHPDAL